MSQASPTRVVGIHNSGAIASAALVVDGRVVAGSPEERFTRVKHDRSFPHAAIRFCLDHARLDLSQVDVFAIGWNAGENASLKYRPGYSDWMRYPGEWLASIPNHLLPKIGRATASSSEFALEGGTKARIEFVDHHLSHATFASETSGFADSAVLVVDGWSEQKVTSIWRRRNGQLEPLAHWDFPNSIGCYYAAATDFLGYRPFSDEWKVMGMAAYGDPATFGPAVEKLIRLDSPEGYELDLSYFDFYNFDRGRFCGPKLAKLLGPPRQPKEPLARRHFDLAAAFQAFFEKVMLHLLRRAHALTGSDAVALGGGTALNCLFNGKVVGKTPFKHCYVTFAPDDSGNSIGAALAVTKKLGVPLAVQGLGSAIGAAYSDDEIGATIDRYKLRGRRLGDRVRETAALLASGKVVGWFQGRAEFGQRALGHRSILASPREAGMKDRINADIKYREAYRPFAPVLPLEALDRYFEGADRSPVRFMEKTYPFRADVAKHVAAVVHQDGTGRLQTVETASEPELHRLLEEFGRLTGHPVLVNTSFNLNGEPVVNSPDDAVRTFVTSGIDALVIGDLVLEKGAL